MLLNAGATVVPGSIHAYLPRSCSRLTNPSATRAISCMQEVGGPGQAALGRARALLVIGSRRAWRSGAPATSPPPGSGTARRHRRRRGLAVEPAAAGDPCVRRTIGMPKVESAAALIPPPQSARRRRAASRPPHGEECARSHRPLRHRRRRLGQFHHALSRLRRLLFRPQATGDARRSAPFDGTLTTIRAHERGTDGKPNPTYRLPVSGAAAAGHRCRHAPRRESSARSRA